MPYPFAPSPIDRLSVRPHEPERPLVLDGARVKKSRRPHSDARVASVRQLIEETTLTYAQIAAKTGVAQASICRWTRDGGWQRPLFAPRATDTVPSARAGRKLKQRLLAGRLHALAERMIGQMEANPRVGVDELMRALEVLKMARLEAMGRRRRPKWTGRAETGAEYFSRQDAIRTALKEMRRGGVDLDRAPKAAVDMVIDASLPVEDGHPALRERGRRR